MKKTITDYLENLHITYRCVDHPAVFTVAESMQHLSEKLPVKNLLLAEQKGGRKILVIMAGQDRLDIARLAQILATTKLQFASQAVLAETLGVTPGSVSLFCLLHDGSSPVEVAVDNRLLQAEEVGFHPNDNTSTIFIPGSAIATIVQATGHKMTVLDI